MTAGAAGAAGSTSVGGTLTFDVSDDLVVRALESPRGQKVLLKVMSRRPRSFNRALGRN